MSKVSFGAALLGWVDKDHIVALECSKGRGIILPGGTVEEGEYPVQAAIREFEEETGGGLVLDWPELIYQGPSISDPCFTYCFQSKNVSLKEAKCGSNEGKVKICKPAELMTGKFAQYYSIFLFGERFGNT